jgi:tetratricopeptide (TPR) repeat protein
MSTHKAPIPVTRRHELREDKVVTAYSRLMTFFEDNRTLVFWAIGAVVLLLVIGAGYNLYQGKRETQAQTALAPAVRAYERGEYQKALDGEESSLGLIAASERYAGTDAGNLAAYYAGDALFRQGKFDEALPYFGRFDKENNVLGAAAYAAEAAILENKGEYARAAERYEQAAAAFASDFMTPQNLLSAGRSYERAGLFDRARAAYEHIRESYPESGIARDIDYYLARTDAQEQAAE